MATKEQLERIRARKSLLQKVKKEEEFEDDSDSMEDELDEEEEFDAEEEGEDEEDEEEDEDEVPKKEATFSKPGRPSGSKAGSKFKLPVRITIDLHTDDVATVNKIMRAVKSDAIK